MRREQARQVARILANIADDIERGTRRRWSVGITLVGSEHGKAEMLKAAHMAQAECPEVEVVTIGPAHEENLAQCVVEEEKVHDTLEKLLDEGKLAAAVTMHYNFPLGVATVGRVVTPVFGKSMFIATTTGTPAANRVAAMVKGAIYGIITAKASGLSEPTVGILNVDGARQVERLLRQLQQSGYPLKWATSKRSDGGNIMRGNDVIQGVPDVLVTDSLTGNLLVKIFSAYTSGGNYEAVGYGYGPGIGEGYRRLIMIISRASGAPVAAGAIRFAYELLRGDVWRVAEEEFAKVRAAGLEELLAELETRTTFSSIDTRRPTPPLKTVTCEISGIDIMQLEAAQQALWDAGVYAETGMGCTGPVILVAPDDAERAEALLREKGYI